MRSNESSTAVAYVNAAKAVEFVFSDGTDVMTGRRVGLETGDAGSFQSFEEFYRAFLRQWENLIEESVRIGNAYEGKLAQINPSNLYSATVENALKQGV